MSSLNCRFDKTEEKWTRLLARLAQLNSAWSRNSFQMAAKNRRKKVEMTDYWHDRWGISRTHSVTTAFKMCCFNVGESMDDKRRDFCIIITLHIDKRAGNGLISCLQSQPDRIQRHNNCEFRLWWKHSAAAVMSDDKMIGCDKTSHHHKLPPKSLCDDKKN